MNFREKAIRIFVKNGGDGDMIKIFDHLPIREREDITRKAGLKNRELPIIGGSDNGEYFLILTDRRLIQFEEKLEKFIELKELSEVKADLTDVKLDPKRAWHQIETILVSKQSVFFKLESGNPFFGLWNVLLFVASRNNSSHPND